MSGSEAVSEEIVAHSLAKDPVEALRDAFIRYVYNVFLLRGDRHNPTPDMFEALLQRARRTDQHHACLSRFSQDSRAEDESAQRSGVDQP